LASTPMTNPSTIVQIIPMINFLQIGTWKGMNV